MSAICIVIIAVIFLVCLTFGWFMGVKMFKSKNNSENTEKEKITEKKTDE